MMIADKACYERGCACYDPRVDSDGVEVVEKREWVGLTEVQFQQAWDDADTSFKAWGRGIRGQQLVPQDSHMWHFWKAIQNKLKELNT
jgi:hypothetical protein